MPNPVEPPSRPGPPTGPSPVESAAPSISLAADRARAQLHEEIERVRAGVEEMLTEQSAAGRDDEALRRELDALREDTRLYVKKRTRRTEKKMGRRIGSIEDRTERLEARIEQVEADRAAAEVRIHSDTERMLDGLLEEVRAIADLLTRET